MAQYDGEDRRSVSRDHDLLLELKGILLQQNAMMDGQKRSLETHVKAFDTHVLDDKTSFNALWKLVGSIRWYVAIGIGVVVTLEFASKYLLPGHP